MSRPVQGRPSYTAVLALPRARVAFCAALLARLCYGLQGLALLFSIQNVTASLATTSLAVSTCGLAIALLIPVRARLVQRHRAAFPLLAACYALSLSALAAASVMRLPVPVVIGLAVVAGLFPPPVGPVMRALWSRLAPDEAHRQRALSLDTAAESTAFATGPALAGILIPVLSAPVLLAMCAVLVLGGCILLTSAAAGTVATSKARKGARRAGRPFCKKGFPVLVLLTCAVAAAVSAAELAAVGAWGAQTTGVAMALFSAGGVAGGLAYGRQKWRWPLSRRPVALTAAAAACYAVPALAFARPAACVALLVAGACTDVLLVTTYQLVNVLVAEGRRVEAGAWLNTAYNLGAAAGTGAGGFLAVREGPDLSFAIIAAALIACVLAGLPLSRRN